MNFTFFNEKLIVEKKVKILYNKNIIGGLKMKRIIKTSIFIFIALFACKTNVNAMYIDGSTSVWEKGEIVKITDGKEGSTQYKTWLEDGTVAFCVEHGINFKSGEVDTETLTNYFKNGLTEEKTKELVKQISEYLYFGYGNEGKNSDEYYLATQKLIWEAISKSGFYASEYYANRIQSYNFTTIEYKYKNGDNIDLTDEVKNINNAISKYYAKPSICSSNLEELEVGEVIRYEDTNKVLDQYNVTCADGIKCEKNGNVLKITGIKEGKNQKITLSKSEVKKEIPLYIANGYQGVITKAGNLEAVSCNNEITTFVAPVTADINITLIMAVALISGMMMYITYKSVNENKMLNK